jgi:hypothetical protein
MLVCYRFVFIDVAVSNYLHRPLGINFLFGDGLDDFFEKRRFFDHRPLRVEDPGDGTGFRLGPKFIELAGRETKRGASATSLAVDFRCGDLNFEKLTVASVKANYPTDRDAA